MWISCAGGPQETGDMSPKALWQSKCTQCHALERSAEKRLSPDEWRTIVNRMQGKMFSNISEQQADVILDYLIETRSR
jgi:cytochrome c2